MRKRIFITIIVFVAFLGETWGQQTIIAPENRIASSFAVFIDSKSYQACKEAVMDYKTMLEKEGLATWLLVADWESPEHVKFFLQKYYNEQALEGAVFIGDIPVPMIRRAQHMTSAFKMNEQAPMRESSVPSDRFYDDFNLKFSFIKRDSTNRNFFYYNLCGDGPQEIHCNIYTGRIKPTKVGADGYKQINDYLKKVVEERSVENPLDKVCSYTGHGSFSNSLSAWKDESVTLREQMPAAFKNADGAKFYLFYMYPSMKETVIKELKRPDVDVMLFHEHGMPHRQYLTGEPDAYSDDENFEAGKLHVRQLLRRAKAMGKDVEARKEELMKEYGIDTLWFAGAFDKGVEAQDSLKELEQGIVLEDVPEIAPNPRFVIFDACYNGDFREQRFIAGEYIFAAGKTLACFANSVNVLQDKSSSDLMGLLSCGFRIGAWAQQVNILESHIIGDPTYRFSKTQSLPQIRINSKDTAYWLAVLNHNLPYDIKGLALYKLFDLKYDKLSGLLLDIYKHTPSYMLRLQSMHLLAYYNDGSYVELLKLATKDPYEFIRRKAAYYMGKVGRNDFIPYIVDLYLDDYLSERVAFNIIRSAGMLNTSLLKEEFKKKIDNAGYIYDKEAFYKEIERQLNSGENMLNFCWGSLIDTRNSPKKRLSYISSIRNNPYPQMVGDMLNIVKNKEESPQVRTGVIEALGWYVRSERKGEILAACRQVLSCEENITPEIADELNKTISRLETYMR